MKHEFYCRLRRYFRDEEYECWGGEFDYGEGYIAEDKIILQWSNSGPKVLMITVSDLRMKSDEYTSIIWGLFEDLTEGEGTFEIRRLCDMDVDEYDIEDLKKKHEEIFFKRIP